MTLFKSPNISYKLKTKLNIINYFFYLKNKRIKLNTLLHIQLIKKLLAKSCQTRLRINQITTKYNSYLFRLSKSFTKLSKTILAFLKDLFIKFKSYMKLLKEINLLKNLDSKDIKSRIKPILKRLVFSIFLYFPPFFLLLKHSLIPGISVCACINDGLYLLVNQFLLRLIGNIPYLLNMLEYVLPVLLSENMPNIQFALLYSYFLIFAANHRALRIPYEIAYHGTVAFAFLTFQYALNLIQDFIIYPFDLYLVFLQSFAQIEFEARIGFPIYKMFVDLNSDILLIDLMRVIQRFEFHKTMIAKFIISPVAFVALCALVYNCLYYVLKKKNPRILFISNTVSRVMTDGKDDLL